MDKANSVALYGTDLFGDAIVPQAKNILSARFGVPPFSVLNAREGEWQERKRAWIALGIRSELGRGADLQKTGANSAYGGNGFAGPRGGRLRTDPFHEGGLSIMDRPEYKKAKTAPGLTFNDSSGWQHKARSTYNNGKVLARGTSTVKYVNATPGGAAMPAMDYSKRQRGDGRGRPLDAVPDSDTVPDAVYDPDALEDEPVDGGAPQNSTSIFDPVLCELCYSWFCPAGGQVIDPFAGGSVRGIVAAVSGRDYYGTDLSGRQIEANREQADLICDALDKRPMWRVGCSSTTNWPSADFLFSCPPYGDLEVYSRAPEDLSNMSWPEFCAAYFRIIARAAAALKNDRFAAFVVGDFRDKDGFYRNFPSLTVDAFEAAGMNYYNEAILLTAVGSLPVRINAQWIKARKLGKTHQNVMIFVKGDPRKAAAAVEFDPKEPELSL